MSGYVRYSAPDLFGSRSVIACGDGTLEVRPIAKDCADEIIRTGHYSHSVVWSSSLHLGVFLADGLIGALQFGVGMNPASGARVVKETAPHQWLELNRLWMAEGRPDNAGTRVLAYALRLVRHQRPSVKWVQTFADERCGRLGAIYQAASFLYCGSHNTRFYELDGQWFHQSLRGRATVDKRGWGSGPKAAYFRVHQERATAHTFAQYRYIKFLDQRWQRRLLLPVLPYPKPSGERKRASA